MAPETPKGVSSRLLSMKFMQRAVASAASTPGSGSEPPSSKKRKLGHSPADDEFSANIDQAAVQAAIDDREAKRQAALEKHAGNDTHWVLPTNLGKKQKREEKQPLKVVYVGYGDLDSSGEDSEGASKPARTSTAKYKSFTTSVDDWSVEEDEDEDSEADSPDETEVNTPASQRSRSRSQSRSNSKPSYEATKAKEFRDKRKKKEVRLNKLSSISSAGASSFGTPGSQNSNKSMTCYNCQQTGHKASDCPSKGSKVSKGSNKRR
ncbi:hypothetical protein ACRE_012740 [Hapsidospora chrysogenum ATCC 11550]|uniref:CCHC-type domain-containing protein n=1 Tax=Hapsidospora chrysogenum (strain ATCC 11550 / CBS 779.69 / DSM 880 / IAM 14645 / JCM 23072 / IMI 49137) TaxID=857340 RepID=A0A086TF31_HAPC1|nr:hypothetical protein ACRE_012740 [Hapsidospora chrysogenum ATCC 11550]